MLAPPAWTRRAECRDLAPAEADRIFFRTTGLADALALCERCPVRRECLQRCAAAPETWAFGVWGGTSAEERRNYLVNGTPM